jgi:hypothetical protein
MLWPRHGAQRPACVHARVAGCARTTAPDVATATIGECLCPAGWSGTDCSVGVGCLHNCSGHGVCDGDRRTCTCAAGYSGGACEVPHCIDCGGHGRCLVPDVCSCDEGYGGSTCREPRCLHNCSGASGHGTCAGPNRCRCAAGWSGADCSEAICDEPCGAHGKCIGANRCACDAGWKGARCDVPECSSVMYFRARARDGASRGLRGRRRSGGRRHRHRAGPRAGLLRRRCV